MQYHFLIFSILSLLLLSACSSSSDNTPIDGTTDANEPVVDVIETPDMDVIDTPGMDVIDSMQVDVSQGPISTATLPFSGTDREIPVLVPRIRIDLPSSAEVALSPAGDEVAVVTIGSDNTRVNIYNTISGLMNRTFLLPLESRVLLDLVLWSEDDALTIIYDSRLNGHVVDAQTGNVLLAQFDAVDRVAFFDKRDIRTFDSRTNELYGILLTGDGVNAQTNIHRVNTRDLSFTLINSAQLGSPRRLTLARDNSEVSIAFTEMGIENCCVPSNNAFFDTVNTFEFSREIDTRPLTYLLLGNGFDIVFDELESELRIGADGPFIEASSNSILSSLDGNIAGVSRPLSAPVNGDLPARGTRLITLPEGIVIGDIVNGSAFNALSEQSIISNDGALVAVTSDDVLEIYTTESRTDYTVLSTTSPDLLVNDR